MSKYYECEPRKIIIFLTFDTVELKLKDPYVSYRESVEDYTRSMVYKGHAIRDKS